MKNNGNQINKYMDLRFQKTYGMLHQKYKDNKQDMIEFKNLEDQQDAILMEQKMRQHKLNKIQYTEYLTKSYKTIRWKCSQIAYIDSKTGTKTDKYNTENHASKECLSKPRCGCCGHMVEQYKCFQDSSFSLFSLLQIRCYLGRFTGYFANKCMFLFQGLTSMYLGNKKALNMNNKIKSTGISRMRFGANYRRNSSNRRRRVRH